MTFGVFTMENKETKQVKKYPHEALEHIENVRAEFYKKFKLHDKLKKIVFAVCFVGMIASFIVGLNVLGGNQFLQLGLPLILLGVMLVYSVIVKRFMDSKMREFFKVYYKGINEYVLDGKDIKDVSLCEPGKITKEEFIANKIYKDIFDVGSRGKTEFTYKKLPMFVVDCAAQIKGNKRIYPVFVGKYLECPSKVKDAEPTIVYLKGTGTVLPPTNIENLKVVLDNKVMTIYSNSKNWKTTISPKVIKLLEDIKTNKLLVDLTVGVHNKKAYVCMGYDDPIMVPPFMSEFDPSPDIQYKGELEKILKVVEALN